MAIFRPRGHENGHNSGTKNRKMLPNAPKRPQRRGLQTVHWRKSRSHIKKRIFGPKYCIFGPKNLFFSTLRPHNSFFWPLTTPTQWDHIFPMSSGNSGYLRFSCRRPLGCSAGRFLAPIAQNGPFWPENLLFLRYAHITPFFGLRDTWLNGIISSPYPKPAKNVWRTAGTFILHWFYIDWQELGHEQGWICWILGLRNKTIPCKKSQGVLKGSNMDWNRR